MADMTAQTAVAHAALGCSASTAEIAVALDALETAGALAVLSTSPNASLVRARVELANSPCPKARLRARNSIRVSLVRLALLPVERTHGVKFRVRSGTGSMRGSSRVSLGIRSLPVFEAAVAALEAAGFCRMFNSFESHLGLARALGGRELDIDWSVTI